MKDYLQIAFFFIFGNCIAGGMGIVGHAFGGMMEAVFFFVALILYVVCFIKVIRNYEKKRTKSFKQVG